MMTCPVVSSSAHCRFGRRPIGRNAPSAWPADSMLPSRSPGQGTGSSASIRSIASWLTAIWMMATTAITAASQSVCGQLMWPIVVFWRLGSATSTGRRSTPAFWHCTVERARMAGCNDSSRTGEIPFTGPGAASAALAMSKQATKAALRAAGVPTPADAAFDAETPLAVLCDRAAALGFPVVVKPDGQGSSLGVGMAQARTKLPPAETKCCTMATAA